jgi:hypothetical protein
VYLKERQQNIFTVATKINEKAVLASSITSQITANKSKRFADGD